MQRSALCRSRRELSNEYLLAKIGVDTAENELLKVLFNIIQYYSIVSLVLGGIEAPVQRWCLVRPSLSVVVNRNFAKPILAPFLQSDPSS